jgi:hypothetical protein
MTVLDLFAAAAAVLVFLLALLPFEGRLALQGCR